MRGVAVFFVAQEEARGRTRGDVTLAGVGMLATEQLVDAAGKTTRPGWAWAGEKLVELGACRDWAAFIFPFSSVFVSVFVYSFGFSSNKIANHFLKSSKLLCGLSVHVASHSQVLEIFEIQII